MRTVTGSLTTLVLLTATLSTTSSADVVLFDTGAPLNTMAMASRPPAGGLIEIEAADDFIANNPFRVNSATFTGLLTGATPTVTQVAVEIYRVFPLDSNTVRTPAVPTRANSPSDVAFATRDSGAGELSFTTATVAPTFTALNSVLNGINKSPNQTTNGEGPVTGREVTFTVNLTTPFNLPADHYFFVPQVAVTGGQFFWLSGQRPIAGQFAFAPDLQAWIRNANLDPDWLRVGTDIVGGATPPTFNGAFSLVGVPEPSSLVLIGLGASVLLARSVRRARRDAPPPDARAR